MEQSIYREATVIGQDLLRLLVGLGPSYALPSGSSRDLMLSPSSPFSGYWGSNHVGITCAHEPHCQLPRP